MMKSSLLLLVNKNKPKKTNQTWLSNLLSRITDSVGPTETSIAPRQRPKAANSNVLPLATVTPVKMTVPSAPVSNGQKGLL